MILIICVAVLVSHKVNDSIGGRNKHNLHACVVQGGKVPEEIKIAGCEDDGTQLQTFERNTCCCVSGESMMYEIWWYTHKGTRGNDGLG